MSSSNGSSGLGVSDIVGIVIGGVLGLVTIIGLIFSCYAMCCKKDNKAQVWAEPGPYPPPNGAYGQPMNTGYYSQQSPYYKQPMNNDQPPPPPPPPYSTVYPGSNSYGKY